MLQYNSYNVPLKLDLVKPTGGHYEIYGISFDPSTNKLWWNGGEYYNVTTTQDPSVGCCTLDLDAGTIAAVHGPWAMDRGEADPTVNAATSHRTKTGSLEIPQWFADMPIWTPGASRSGPWASGGCSPDTAIARADPRCSPSRRVGSTHRRSVTRMTFTNGRPATKPTGSPRASHRRGSADSAAMTTPPRGPRATAR
jgi:hypothetical protein